MRRIFGLGSAMLAACSTAPAQPVVHGQTPGHTCKADGTEQFVGQTRSDQVGAEIKRVSNAAIKRALGIELLYPTYREGLAAILGAERAAQSEPA